MEECVIALDAGIGGGRSLVCDLSGRAVASVYREWSYTSLPSVPGSSVFDAEALWSDLCIATRGAMASGGISAQAVRAISATSQREALILTGAHGRVLHAASSMDARGSAENEALAATHGKLIYETSGQRLNAVHAPGRLRWLRIHEPSLFDSVQKLFMVDSWLCYKMSGEAVIEPSSASASLLFDIRRCTWSDSICDLAGVPAHILPSVGVAGRVVGGLSRPAAEGLGLMPGTPIVLGGGDGQCGMVGLGAVEPAQAGAIAGTTTPILLTVAEPRLDAKERTWTRCHVVPGLWVVEANAGATGLSYRWLRDLLWARDGEEAGPTTFDDMDRSARTAPIGTAGLRAYLGGSAADLRRRDIVQRTGDLRGVPIGEPAAKARAAITRATLENIAFVMRYNVGLLQQVTGAAVSTLFVGGGQTRSKLWREIVADVLGIPLLVGAPEAAALGAAACAWVGAGYAADVATAGHDLARHTTVLPNPVDREHYDAAYQAWLDGAGSDS